MNLDFSFDTLLYSDDYEVCNHIHASTFLQDTEENIFSSNIWYFISDGPSDIFTQDLPHHGNVQKNSAHDNQENCRRYIHHMVFQGIYHDIA